MTDDELAKEVSDAAWVLARAMNKAGEAGLAIELEMRAHSSTADTRHVYKTGNYRPFLKITRTVTLV